MPCPLMELVIEAYSILLTFLKLFVDGFLGAVRVPMLHFVSIAVFPIFFPSIMCYATVMAFMRVVPRQDSQHCAASSTRTSPTPVFFGSHSSSSVADSQFNHHDISPTTHLADSHSSIVPVEPPFALSNTPPKSSTADPHNTRIASGLLTDILEGCIKNATDVKTNDRIQTSPHDSATAILSYHPPAIPDYLKECEFYRNTADMSLEENSGLLKKGQEQLVRVTVGPDCRTCDLGCARDFLRQHIAEDRIQDLIFKEVGGVEPCEGMRGKLELGSRVYVGPVDWLLKVLVEETESPEQ